MFRASDGSRGKELVLADDVGEWRGSSRQDSGRAVELLLWCFELGGFLGRSGYGIVRFASRLLLHGKDSLPLDCEISNYLTLYKSVDP